MDLLGVAASNCINLAVVLNYSIQCEMLRYYVNTIGTRLKERSADLKGAMKVGVYAMYIVILSPFYKHLLSPTMYNKRSFLFIYNYIIYLL